MSLGTPYPSTLFMPCKMWLKQISIFSCFFCTSSYFRRFSPSVPAASARKLFTSIFPIFTSSSALATNVFRFSIFSSPKITFSRAPATTTQESMITKHNISSSVPSYFVLSFYIVSRQFLWRHPAGRTLVECTLFFVTAVEANCEGHWGSSFYMYCQRLAHRLTKVAVLLSVFFAKEVTLLAIRCSNLLGKKDFRKQLQKLVV